MQRKNGHWKKREDQKVMWEKKGGKNSAGRKKTHTQVIKGAPSTCRMLYPDKTGRGGQSRR